MKSCSSNLNTHIGLGQTTCAHFLKLTLADGTIIGLTDHDVTVTISGVDYLPYPGISPFNLADKANQTTSVQIDGPIDDTVITADMIRARKFDGCKMQLMLANWMVPTDGVLILATGTTGTWGIKEYSWSTEFYGMAKKLENVAGELCSPGCRVDFGSARCAPGGALADSTTIDSLMQTGAVTSTDGVRTIVVSGISDLGKPLAPQGLLTWTAGNNSGLSVETYTIDFGTSTIVLKYQAVEQIQIGDTFRLMPACQKRFYEDCVSTYKNGVNFQGEPHVPGSDFELDYPDFRMPHA